MIKKKAFPHQSTRRVRATPGKDRGWGYGQISSIRHPRHPAAHRPAREQPATVFYGHQDRWRYLSFLADALAASGSRLHPYVLMDNHTHLLATPGRAGRVSAMMAAPEAFEAMPGTPSDTAEIRC
jgi:hypothetical protein